MSPRKSRKNQSKNKTSGMFNFLEKLLVFCTMGDRSVPPESGVRFGICVPQDDMSVCIVVKIDQQPDFLFQQKGIKRPDYLAVYIRQTEIICTIIEMKGKDRHETERGVEQIASLKDRLVSELREHLPAKFLGRTKFQGILLAPYNSQMPGKAIERQAARGLVIRFVPYSKKADLYPFVSKLIKLTDSTRAQAYDSAKDRQFHFIERLLVQRAHDQRLNDSFYRSNFHAGSDRRGIYLNFILHDTGEYFALFVSNDSRVIAVWETSRDCLDAIRQAMDECGYGGIFRIRPIE
jgi:hypothetical protein